MCSRATRAFRSATIHTDPRRGDEYRRFATRRSGPGRRAGFTAIVTHPPAKDRVTVWIALPMMAVMLFVNLVLGVIARVAPQSNIFALGFPITISVGLVGMMAMLPMLESPFMTTLGRMLSAFGG